MRHARILLTTLTLVVTALTAPGCAGPRAGLAAGENATENGTSLGRLDDPAFVFSQWQASKAKQLKVKALAYTGCSSKAKRAPRGAWGDPLTGDVKAVAISPDLIKLGLDHGDTIRIEGLPGEYKVLDVMHGRHSRAIDIYYGEDQCGAREWGTRSLTITWQ